MKREMVGNIAYFGAYEMMKQNLLALNEGNEETSGKQFGAIALSGAIAGVAYWATVYPIDTIKSLMQADSLATPKFSGTFHCLTSTVRESGMKRLYVGMSPSLVRALPSNAVTFVAYETCLSFIEQTCS